MDCRPGMLAEAFLRIQGVPIGPSPAPWDEAGAQAFLERGFQAELGSLEELRSWLGLLDHEVDVELIREGWTPLTVVGSERGSVRPGIAPAPAVGRLRITWARESLARHARTLGPWVGRLVAWWTPFGWAEPSWSMGWRRGGLVAVAEVGRPEESEAEMPVDDTSRVESLGIGELALVAVGADEQQHDPLPGPPA